MDQHIFNHFQQMIEATMHVGESCAESIAEAADKLSSTLLAGNTIFSCGESVSIHLSQMFVDYLSQGFEIERPGFPAININQLSQNSFGPDRYAQAIHTHGRQGDILVVFSTGNNSLSLHSAIETAVEKGMAIIILSNNNDQLLTANLSYNDIHVNTSGFSGEMSSLAQLQVIQCLCALIDKSIFGAE